MCQPYIESATALFYYIHEEITTISVSCWSADVDLHCLAEPRNVSLDLKYDVLCLKVFVRVYTYWRSNGLNFFLVGGTTCCNPTWRVLPHSD